jgi:hypothetical protein
MKFLSTFLATTAFVLVATAALAQTYDPSGNAKFRVARGYISATSPVGDRIIQDPAADLWAYYRCGTAVSITFLKKLLDGTTLDSQAVACDTTSRAVSITAPVPFQMIAASATTAVSTTAGGVSITLIETKK